MANSNQTTWHFDWRAELAFVLTAALLNWNGQSTYKQYCDVKLRRASSDQVIGRFHGPLTFGPNTVYWEIPESTKLVRVDQPTDLRLEIGTMDKQRGCWTVVATSIRESNFSDNVYWASRLSRRV